jgi:hypothetical protein
MGNIGILRRLLLETRSEGAANQSSKRFSDKEN